jgi:hypothetical protein
MSLGLLVVYHINFRWRISACEMPSWYDHIRFGKIGRMKSSGGIARENVSNLQQTTPDLLSLQELTERMSETELSDRQLHNPNLFRPSDPGARYDVVSDSWRLE